MNAIESLTWSVWRGRSARVAASCRGARWRPAGAGRGRRLRGRVRRPPGGAGGGGVPPAGARADRARRGGRPERRRRRRRRPL
eukprot:760216-Prorocentrum_minimum.AAC.1